MINLIVRNVCKMLLCMRYQVSVHGVDRVVRRGRRGILLLPNHPALIDPPIVMAWLSGAFTPRVMADEDQIDRFFIRWAARRMGVWALPDIRKRGIEVRPRVESIIRDAIADLKHGGNLLLYPSGHSYRTRYEDLRGNSAVETVLREVPEARVVLVRTRGLWGSSFSHAQGAPSVARALKHGVLKSAESYFVWTPKRKVSIELYEPTDLPRGGSRQEINAYLEKFYNEEAPPNTFVPYSIWEGNQPVTVPEPHAVALSGSLDDVPETTRRLVREYIAELTGVQAPRDGDKLAHDLGMDSLDRADLVVFLGREFGYAGADVDDLQTVGDVMLAARGQNVITKTVGIKPPPARWFPKKGGEVPASGEGRKDASFSPRTGAPRVRVPADATIAEAFLTQAARSPDRLIVADQISGVRTYRDVVMGVMALHPSIERLAGERIGVMLPASVGADVTYLACLFAGKAPVMVNWTTGSRNILQSLDMLGVQHILTAAPLVARIEAHGTDLSAFRGRFVFLEKMRQGMSRREKLSALVRSRLSWASLRQARVPEVAAILLTSGSETQPKAVPLSHANILSNLRATLDFVRMYEDDCLLGFLPPFHSFGLTVGVMFPLLAGVRAVYHPNPTEAVSLCRLLEAYGANLLVGTPTFLAGIIRASKPGQLASLRLAVTGAEKCPQRTYAAIAERCPNATVIEGYGITECSPIVAANDENDPQPCTIGKVLASLEYAIVDVDSGQRVRPGEPGILLVRGPSIFSGYLNPDVASPFVEFEGRQWYRTGDLVTEDGKKVLTFRGRLKRFVKIGGEMISLPAIESALDPHYASDADEGPVIAVEATPVETQPELVLFTTRPANRQTVNAQIRGAGLSPLHNISRVIQIEQMPVLGTGKTDYRTLKQMLER
jgi:long-chain-fatty-acid--[acyl-carrier-protein] ligase